MLAGPLVNGTTTLELPREAGSAGIARLIVSAHGASLSRDRLKSANLMVTELVTNACRHGTGQIQLIVRSGTEGIRAEVQDEGGAEIEIAPAQPRPPRGGWGLYFVDRLADTWGVEAGEARVWFRIADQPAL
jgi:anti-sigma regulatory factor (Ser/Thr protein kinase)